MKQSKLRNRYLQMINEEFIQTTETLWENEIQANKYVAKILLETAFIDLIFMVCTLLRIFTLDIKVVGGIMFHSFLELLAAAFICLHFKGRQKWLKSIMLFFYTLVLARITMVLTHNVILAMVFPTIVSVRYYSKPVTMTVSFLSAILFPLADYLSIKYKTGIINLNVLRLAQGTSLYWDKEATLREIVMSQAELNYTTMWANMFRHYELPKIALFIMVSIICVEIAKRGRMAILAQKEETAKTERISTELNLASDIQSNMLPSIFPAFPEMTNFDIFASMNPAKEVGGDFYDFFLIDDHTMAIEIADVSGKGIPAALFMVIAKTLIKDHAQLGLSPAEIFTKVNNILCESNEAGLFVTAWLGIIDLRNGRMTYVNAGHNPPVIKVNGEVQYLKQQPGFVLAGMEDYKYKEFKLQLNPGDRIFLYTDGATEATNEYKELYGEERLLKCLKEQSGKTCEEALKTIHRDIDEFVGTAEQFDDLTLLAYEFKGDASEKRVHKHLPADINKLNELTDFIREELENQKIKEKIIYKIILSFEEVFANICNYAYQEGNGDVEMDTIISKEKLQIILTDKGTPFNPLNKEDPDVNLPSEEREIGGLGIFMTKKLMDECSYERVDDKNVFTMTKYFS